MFFIIFLVRVSVFVPFLAAFTLMNSFGVAVCAVVILLLLLLDVAAAAAGGGGGGGRGGGGGGEVQISRCWDGWEGGCYRKASNPATRWCCFCFVFALVQVPAVGCCKLDV